MEVKIKDRKEEIIEKASEYVDSVRNRIDSYAYLDVQEAFAEGAKWMQEQVNGADLKNDKALHKHFVSNSEAEFCECDIKDPEIKGMWVVCGNCGKVIKDE